MCAFVLFKLDCFNSLLSGCPLYILRRLQEVQSSATKLVFKSHRHDHVRPLLQALHWLPVQARVDCKMSTISVSVTTSSLTHPLPASLTFSLCKHLLHSFVLVQTHGHFTSPILKRKPVASVLSLTLLQSNGILSLVTFVTFNPPMPSSSKLH